MGSRHKGWAGGTRPQRGKGEEQEKGDLCPCKSRVAESQLRLSRALAQQLALTLAVLPGACFHVDHPFLSNFSDALSMGKLSFSINEWGCSCSVAQDGTRRAAMSIAAATASQQGPGLLAAHVQRAEPKWRWRCRRQHLPCPVFFHNHFL